MEKPEYGGTWASVRRGTLLTVSTAMFSQSKKKGHKRGALSRALVQLLVSLQEHDLTNLKAGRPAWVATAPLHPTKRSRLKMKLSSVIFTLDCRYETLLQKLV